MKKLGQRALMMTEMREKTIDLLVLVSRWD